MITTMTFWKRQNYTDNKKISGYQGLGEGRNEKAESMEDF